MMQMADLPQALGVNSTPGAELALGRIATAAGVTVAEMVPLLYDPANREVLDLLRATTDADTITAAWDRLHPTAPAPAPAVEVLAELPKDTFSPAATEPVPTAASSPAPPGDAAPAAPFHPSIDVVAPFHPSVDVVAGFMLDGKRYNIIEA